MDEMLARACEFYLKRFTTCFGSKPTTFNEFTSLQIVARDFVGELAAFARSECLLRMEADCKAVCPYCEGGLRMDRGYHMDSYGNGAGCKAAPIREAMKKLQSEMEA